MSGERLWLTWERLWLVYLPVELTEDRLWLTGDRLELTEDHLWLTVDCMELTQDGVGLTKERTELAGEPEGAAASLSRAWADLPTCGARAVRNIAHRHQESAKALTHRLYCVLLLTC